MECSPDAKRILCPMHLCTATNDLHLGCGIALSFGDHSSSNSTDVTLANPTAAKKDPAGATLRGLLLGRFEQGGRLVMPSYPYKSWVGESFPDFAGESKHASFLQTRAAVRPCEAPRFQRGNARRQARARESGPLPRHNPPRSGLMIE